MIKIHCEALRKVWSKLLSDWNLFYILLVPGLFGFAFPFYWLVILPLLWDNHGGWKKTLFWVFGYWVFAILVWLIFLFVVFYQSSSSVISKDKNSVQKTKRNGRRNLSASTEDLWSEDRYYPDIQSPDFLVSINAVQPDRVIAEPKMTMDETWDYNYDNKSEPSSANSITFNCKPSQKNNVRTSLMGNNYTFEAKKAYQSLGYTLVPKPSSDTSSCASPKGSSPNLQHQRLNRKSTPEAPQRRRSASASPYGKRNVKHLPSPSGPRSPSLPKRGPPSPLRGGGGINPRHLRPLRDLSRPLTRSAERKKSPLVGNENCSPTPTVIRKHSLSKKALQQSNEGYEKGAMEENHHRPLIDCYLKTVPGSSGQHSRIRTQDAEEETFINCPSILPPTNPGTTERPSNSPVSDEKFDLILASLHGLALDLEKGDFEETGLVSVPSITGEDEDTSNECTFLSQSF